MPTRDFQVDLSRERPQLPMLAFIGISQTRPLSALPISLSFLCPEKSEFLHKIPESGKIQLGNL